MWQAADSKVPALCQSSVREDEGVFSSTELTIISTIINYYSIYIYIGDTKENTKSIEYNNYKQ